MAKASSSRLGSSCDGPSHAMKKMKGLFGQNGNIPQFGKIFSNILLFVKYLVIYHFFLTQVCRVTRVPKSQVI